MRRTTIIVLAVLGVLSLVVCALLDSWLYPHLNTPRVIEAVPFLALVAVWAIGLGLAVEHVYRREKRRGDHYFNQLNKPHEKSETLTQVEQLNETVAEQNELLRRFVDNKEKPAPDLLPATVTFQKDVDLVAEILDRGLQAIQTAAREVSAADTALQKARVAFRRDSWQEPPQAVTTAPAPDAAPPLPPLPVLSDGDVRGEGIPVVAHAVATVSTAPDAPATAPECAPPSDEQPKEPS